MLLITEKTKTENKKTDAEIKQLESKIKAQVDTDTFNTITNNIMTSLKSFQKDLQSYKMQKYERDTKDYADGKVYEWKDKRRKFRKTRPAQCPPTSDRLSTSASEWDFSQTSDVDSQHSGKPFLVNAKPPSQVKQRGRCGGGQGRGSSQVPASQPAQLEQTVMNISGVDLSDEETGVLSKGLSFCPTNAVDPFKLKVDTFKFFRSLQLKQFFSPRRNVLSNGDVVLRNSTTEVTNTTIRESRKSQSLHHYL